MALKLLGLTVEILMKTALITTNINQVKIKLFINRLVILLRYNLFIYSLIYYLHIGNPPLLEKIKNCSVQLNFLILSVTAVSSLEHVTLLALHGNFTDIVRARDPLNPYFAQ